MVRFSQTEAQISLAQINEVEFSVGLNFPNDYKEHLLKYNGGKCIPNVFSFYENGKVTQSGIDWFLAIYDGEYDNLKDYIITYKVEEKRMPSHLLPIAHDPGGNLICISCGGDDEGCVYFWDHENEVDYTESDDSDYSNLYLIAGSFNEFISGLQKDVD